MKEFEIFKNPGPFIYLFLSDPGIPGVQSMGPDVCPLAKSTINASSAIWWPRRQPIHVAPPGGQIGTDASDAT